MLSQQNIKMSGNIASGNISKDAEQLLESEMNAIKGGLDESAACNGGCKKYCITGQVSTEN